MSAKRTFIHTVASLERGMLVDELDSKLKELVNKCRLTEKKGSITLTIDIKPGKGNAFVLEADVKLRLPTEERAATLMFPTPEGFLQRNDPAQGELEGIRSVDVPPEEVRKAS